jgi:aminopeptidase N
MKNTISIILQIALLLQSSHLQAQDRDISYMASGGQLHPLQAIMDIRHYTIGLDVDIAQQTIDGYTTIDVVLLEPTDTILFDLVHFLTVKSVTVNDRKSQFLQKKDYIYITQNQKFQRGKYTIRIEYGGKPPAAVNPPWEGGFTWKTDTKGNPWVSINCQLEGAKVYFPCKDHPSDEPNEGVDLFITVPKGLVVAGPGLLQKTSDAKGDKTTFHWKTNYTISNYCILFNIGKYKVVSRNYTTIDGNKVPVEFYVLEEDVAYAEKVLDIKIRDTKILEKYYGEYPWAKEKIGLAYVPNSGMEHQTMVTYGDRFTFIKVGGQDYSPNLFHEYAHEWWANKVTNRDWAHMWIQEGIGTYSEALFYREAGGEAAYDSIIQEFRMNIANKKPLVQGVAVNSSDTYTGDIYFKGAFFMHTLRYVLGDDTFFSTLKELATDQQYTYDNTVTSDDVEQLFSKRAGKDLKPLFDFYLKTTNRLEIVIEQKGIDAYEIISTNAPMNLPIDLRIDKGTKQIILDNKKLKITSKTPPVVDPKGHYFKKVIMQ